MKTATIMSPAHPSWVTFCNALGGPRGCNFQDKTWVCYGDHRFARALLPEFGVDVNKSIQHFIDHGAVCDCEVLLNLTKDEDEE
jgi:hypothetical protein